MDLNWLDLVILCIILYGALEGMLKGFLISILNIVNLIISLLAAKRLTPFVTSFIIDNTKIFENLSKIFSKRSSTLNPITLNIFKLLNYDLNSVNEMITNAFINVAVFLCIYFISTILMNIINEIIRKKIRKGIFKSIDKLGGLILGITKSLVFLFIIFAVITPIMGIIPQNSELITAIGTSKLAKYFYLGNFIIPWIQKFTI
ncbi:hypothetical protein Q428_06780 [Fervidicella metallireducens AeB]|uniref:Colicin V production protein n=1 Tax=Fervidicella metallireducens AeB TaxID=1403537 RepID=A0A017RXM1_9CLOT|nr:CvpA family protein [Fervidicella metallireducens]EYE88680.1 hypothetical protein Q428_06780 [Fervidicella metallireducens AeB]